MRNPLSILPMFNPSVPDGTFRRGFFKGATSGALMMGIFSGVMGLAGFLGIISNPITLGYALTTIALGSLSTGLFTGIMTSQRSAGSSQAAARQSHQAARREVRAPEQGVAPAMENAVETTRNWEARVGRNSSQNRVSEILADRSLSDGDRASAILRDREQSSTLENVR